MRYQIQKADRNGNFHDYGNGFSDKAEAQSMAEHWSSKNPNCAWGVRVVDTMTSDIIWED